MTPAAVDLGRQIQALEARLLECATSLTGDAVQAQALVRETMTIARDPAYGAGEVVDPQVWIFRLLRQRFHVLGRDQERRRSRTGAVAVVAV
jgi:DNA-directed RNA polymerase specialized sigma24 family protein